MGRLVDLCTEIASASEEGAEGLVLGPEGWERLEQDYTLEEIEDALTIVRESLMQAELTDAADSLSARLIELLGAFGSAEAFSQASVGEARLSLQQLGQLVRRVADTQRTATPSPCRRSAAARIRPTSEPLAIRTSAGLWPSASLSTYAPRRSPSALA